MWRPWLSWNRNAGRACRVGCPPHHLTWQEPPIAQSEIAALTRRFEQAQETTGREFGIVKSDLTALRIQVGNLEEKVANLDQKVGDLDEKVGSLDRKVGTLDQKVDLLAEGLQSLGEKFDRNQAQIIELLTRLVGKNPNAG
ncbi:hypothetical protein ACIHFE_04595 [Streptomyces sp. NPDC052396]|uniref:hypothetical protein n=1 Tax=Streptomyces sp. NPDC052396 TaxID=3365689 RepID=UPI0037CDF8C8